MRIFTTHLAMSLVIAVGLIALAPGCNKQPAHKVNISPPPMPADQAGQKPEKLKEIRPLDTGQAEPADPRHGQTPPTITEASSSTAKPATGTAGAKPYHVRKGDTYWKIAAEQLGNGHRWKEIEKLNPGQDRTKLKPSQVIKIPAK